MNKLFTLILFFVIQNVFSQTAPEIAKTSINSTVSIVALDQISQPLAYGSGFIIDDELIVTNVHVIEGCNSAYILKNGESKKYSVSGYVAIDKDNDLVILKVSGLYGTKLSFGSDTPPEIGEKIYAVGNPKGLNGTFSEGIVSGVRNMQTNQVLQITAPISPGSSGGPVINSSGLVIGIAFASYTSGQNLNFAIPIKYLTNLKIKISTTIPISTIKAQQKSTFASQISPNIKEGVVVRNVDPCFGCGPTMVFFSIKNNLPYAVSDIVILILVYDATGTIVDYNEETYFNSNYTFYTNGNSIKPFLARSIDFNSSDQHAPRVILKSGYYVKARVLDFKINEQ